MRRRKFVALIGDLAAASTARSFTARADQTRRIGVLWPDTIKQYKRAADYVDRIPRGAKPSELPVQTPTKYELILNLRPPKRWA